MKLIGKGAFTKCFLQDCGTKVMLISKDPIKECMGWGWFPESKHFPRVTTIDTECYEMAYIPKVALKANLDADNWQLYQVLRDCFSRSPVVNNKNDLYHEWYKIFSRALDISHNPVVRGGLEDVLAALDACANYGSDIQFEISPRNVRAVNGTLVLMDCFFMVSKLNEVRSSK